MLKRVGVWIGSCASGIVLGWLGFGDVGRSKGGKEVLTWEDQETLHLGKESRRDRRRFRTWKRLWPVFFVVRNQRWG